MKEFGVKNIVFSSSATVYGKPKYLPINEDHPVGQDITNPYGRTKYFIEEILKDVARAESVCNSFFSEYISSFDFTLFIGLEYSYTKVL